MTGSQGSPSGSRPEEHDADRGLFGISVAAELVGMEAPSLRLYESHGLLKPERTAGGTRRYSANDLERLRAIAELLDAGVNLKGIGMVLQLEEENAELRHSKGRRRDGHS
jgi:DNA-binding transcriptional MerR regulator